MDIYPLRAICFVECATQLVLNIENMLAPHYILALDIVFVELQLGERRLLRLAINQKILDLPVILIVIGVQPLHQRGVDESVGYLKDILVLSHLRLASR